MNERRSGQTCADERIHLRDARRMMDARTSVLTAATPPTIAIPMYPSVGCDYGQEVK